MFTKATVPRLEYSSKLQNICLNEKDYYHKFFGVVAAISVDRGLDGVMVFNSAVNRDNFCSFLHLLASKNASRPLHIFMDNLQVHKTAEVHQTMTNLQLQPIWNVPYRFEFQPIELVFSQVKREYKKSKLNAFINEKAFDYEREIESAFKKVKKTTIVNCIRHANELMAVPT